MQLPYGLYMENDMNLFVIQNNVHAFQLSLGILSGYIKISHQHLHVILNTVDLCIQMLII